MPDLIVLHEHPEWQKPLFAALARRGVSFEPFDVTRAAFSNVEPLRASVYFNQARPSAYIRGNTRAVPLALAYIRSPRDGRRPARVLRHQRELQPASVGCGSLWLRSVRARRRLPGGAAREARLNG